MLTYFVCQEGHFTTQCPPKKKLTQSQCYSHRMHKHWSTWSRLTTLYNSSIYSIIFVKEIEEKEIKDYTFINNVLNKEDTEKELENDYDFIFYNNFLDFSKIEIRQNKVSFGKYNLSMYEGPRTYKFNERAKLDDYQNYFIDNIWNITTDVHTMHKRKATIGALINYFNIQALQPQNRKFLCYVVYSDPKPGIYSIWGEAKQSLDKSANPSWAGKYNLEMTLIDISKTLNSKRYYVFGSLEPYDAFKMLCEREGVECSDSPK